jgi:SAM-dependent methyltransferase
MGAGEVVRSGLRRTVPLAVRRGLVRVLGRQRWIPGRYWWALELLRDEAQRDPDAFHRFLWSNHLAYAESYEVDRRFGEGRVHPTRRMLFDDLARVLEEQGMSPAQVNSVFEVGCSLGYLLHYLEKTLFPAATVLEGNDIDRHAVRDGTEFLRRAGSKVRLHQADMADLGALLDGRSFDVVLCAGVLMYLREEEAARVVAAMLRHSRGITAIAGLAHAARDNRELASSERRLRDDTFIHNIDRMVEDAGGRVIARRWEGARKVEGNTIYFVFARPGTA